MLFPISATLLDACILAAVAKEDAYGYSLTQNVKEIIDVSESTLYPVLRRLQKDNYLTAYDKPFSGRNRRYYQITKDGIKCLNAYVAEWQDYKKRVDRLLSGGKKHE